MVTLFRDNQSVARIVLSPDAEPADRRAAEAMQRVTREMSGAESFRAAPITPAVSSRALRNRLTPLGSTRGAP